MKGKKGFTLIELLIAISIAVIITAAVYFGLGSAIDSWQYTKDELALQKVLSGAMNEILEGDDWGIGLRGALELTESLKTRVSFVIPWVEEHDADGTTTLELERYVKPGAGLPMAELRKPEEEIYRPLQVAWADPDKMDERPRLKLGTPPPAGSKIRLNYYPDPPRVPESVVTFRWDSEEKSVVLEKIGETKTISKNSLGVKITDVQFRYYDYLNHLVSENGDLSPDDLPRVSAVEVELTGQMEKHELKLLGMMMLRNSPRQSGLLILRGGLRFPVPDSRLIRTLSLTNLAGISNDDVIELEFQPPNGRNYTVKLRFEKIGDNRPTLAQLTAEYPSGSVVYTSFPKIDPSYGFNLLTFDSSRLYDYDKDPDTEDIVLIEGEPVIMTVKKMDIKAGACFIQ